MPASHPVQKSIGPSRLLVLGAGYVGARALALGRKRGLEVCGTVRSAERAQALRQRGFDIRVAPRLDEGVAQLVDEHTHVVVSFQADPQTDAVVAPALQGAHSVVYVSSTGVYAGLSGRIDDATALPATADERPRRLRAAEDRYRGVSATVLRCPGIYGPDRGLHVRVLDGRHHIAGDGRRVLSRIHADDVAQLALAATHSPAEVFVVGDRAPTPQIEVVRFICERYGVAMPPSIPLEQAPATLQADREVDPSRALHALGVALAYPSYREGMAPEATGLVARSAP